MKNHIHLLLFILFVFLSPQNLSAHAPDQSYLFLKVYQDKIQVRVEMEVDDINSVLGLQLKKGLSVEDLTPYIPQIKAYILERTSFSNGNKRFEMEYEKGNVLVLDLGTFVDLSFKLTGVEQIPDNLDINYKGIFDKIPNHQGMLVVEYNWKAGIFNNESLVSLIFTSSSTRQQLDLTDASVMKGFLTMIWMGVWHIFIGIDHILFLLALVLPAVVFRIKEDKDTQAYYNPVHLPVFGTFNSWNPVAKFRPALIFVLLIVTYFTISHCITLSLAALEIVILPSRLVESIIAISIALAALHNIRPLFKQDWMIAFGFGLFHGFGFASVLGEIGLSGEYMVLSLLGFNLGVELGQIAIICAIFPLLYYLRKSRNYSKILVYGSILLIVISVYWFIERSLDVDLMVDDFFYKVYRKIMIMTGLE